MQAEAARARETGAAKGAEVARLAAEKEVALREAEEVRSTTLSDAPCYTYTSASTSCVRSRVMWWHAPVASGVCLGTEGRGGRMADI